MRTAWGLSVRPDVLVLNATGRDHPRGAGVALHLGALLDIPSIGVTDRPLTAVADEPGAAPGAVADLTLDGARVGFSRELGEAVDADPAAHGLFRRHVEGRARELPGAG